jgi:hypothetical protein
MTAAAFAAFFLQLLPVLREFAHVLFAKHNGNVAAAKADIRRITNHGAQLREFEAEINRKMDELEAARAELAAMRAQGGEA